VLPHSGVPGRAYREIARIGAELARVGGQVADATPDADVAMLTSADARFALAAQPPLQDAAGHGDPASYPRIVGAFYRGAFDAGLQVRVVRPRALFGQAPAEAVAAHPVLVAAGYYPAADGELDWLRRYAEAGGHLVVGPRTGYADQEGRARAQVQPAMLSSAAGAWYDELANLARPVPVAGALSGEATAWAECLVPDGADVLARYEDPHLGVWAAATTRACGAGGRMTLVGTVPGVALARSLAGWLVPTPLAGWSDLPPSVTVHTSTRPDGTRVHVVHNWSWQPAAVTAPTDLDMLVAPRGDVPADPPPADAPGRPVAAGAALRLGSWDVLVAVSR
jgi:beta-galactosidase